MHGTRQQPKLLMIYCFYCSEKNHTSLSPQADIIEATLICCGCARVFHFSLKWNPEIVTFPNAAH